MNQKEPQVFSVKQRIVSFKYAFRGIKIILASQHNFLIQLAMAVLVTAAGLIFRISVLEWCIIVLTIAMVLGAEALNTSIEKLTDMVSPEYDPQAGKIKDIAAGSVLITAIASVIIGLTVFLPKILDRF